MAKIDVIMPQMGESIAEGTLSRWIKKVGDPVKRDEPIFEISTDKVDAEIPAPAAGVLSEVLVEEGQTVAVQTVVAKIETDATAAASSGQAAPAAPAADSRAAKAQSDTAPAPAAVSPAPPASPPTPRPSAPAPPPSPAPAEPALKGRVPAPAAGAAATANGGEESAEERLRRRSTPLVRKMAQEHNVDISAIPGTGLAGRVTKNDMLGYLSGAAGAGTRPAGAGSGSVAPQPTPAEVASPEAATAAPAAPLPRGPAAPLIEPWPGDKVEPWSRIRKLTAEHMVMSRRVSPHVNTIFEIDYTRIVQLRSRKKQEYADRGVNLTYLAFIAKAAADNLRTHPVLNAAVSGESTILR